MKTILNLQPLTEWLPNTKGPLIIAGPCSAESPEQVFSTAEALSKIPQVVIFRAGVWKPRTHPGTYEGQGIEALEWLKEVKQRFGFRTAVEVARPQHVKACLDAGVDILWIGARTTVNPFLVQEIADALEGIEVPVMVKNPVSPDLPLWIGALKRLNLKGITRLIAVHRGFTSSEERHFRNAPEWRIPIELKSLFKDLPVICDPSHIAGKRSLIRELSQKSLNLGFDGLMIETHIRPEQALSDAQQQITPDALAQMLEGINTTFKMEEDAIASEKLRLLRQKIDRVDLELLENLHLRMKIVQEIGVLKREHHLSVLQAERWKELLTHRLEVAQKLDLDAPFIESLFRLIHSYSAEKQIHTD
ncbi:MAG: chorismate mutase [Planctomycetota bacterium]